MKAKITPGWIRVSCHPTANRLVYSSNDEEQIQETISSVDISELITLKISIESIVDISEITFGEAEMLKTEKSDMTKISLVNDKLIYCRESFENVEAKIHRAQLGEFGAILN